MFVELYTHLQNVCHAIWIKAYVTDSSHCPHSYCLVLSGFVYVYVCVCVCTNCEPQSQQKTAQSTVQDVFTQTGGIWGLDQVEVLKCENYQIQNRKNI